MKQQHDEHIIEDLKGYAAQAGPSPIPLHLQEKLSQRHRRVVATRVAGIATMVTVALGAGVMMYNTKNSAPETAVLVPAAPTQTVDVSTGGGPRADAIMALAVSHPETVFKVSDDEYEKIREALHVLEKECLSRQGVKDWQLFDTTPTLLVDRGYKVEGGKVIGTGPNGDGRTYLDRVERGLSGYPRPFMDSGPDDHFALKQPDGSVRPILFGNSCAGRTTVGLFGSVAAYATYDAISEPASNAPKFIGASAPGYAPDVLKALLSLSDAAASHPAAAAEKEARERCEKANGLQAVKDPGSLSDAENARFADITSKCIYRTPEVIAAHTKTERAKGEVLVRGALPIVKEWAIQQAALLDRVDRIVAGDRSINPEPPGFSVVEGTPPSNAKFTKP